LINSKVVSEKQDPKNYSLVNLKNLIESIANIETDKFLEVNSILTSTLLEILKIPRMNIMFFGFVNPSESNLKESLITLEIINKVKMINLEYFFDSLNEMNVSLYAFNNYSKQEFYLIDNIVSKYI
jgi:hypothetical protein